MKRRKPRARRSTTSRSRRRSAKIPNSAVAIPAMHSSAKFRRRFSRFRSKAAHRHNRIDKFENFNRFLGAFMFIPRDVNLVFWVTITFGSAFIDFFDIPARFSWDGFAALLQRMHTLRVRSSRFRGRALALHSDGRDVHSPDFLCSSRSLFWKTWLYGARRLIMDKFMTPLGLPARYSCLCSLDLAVPVPALPRDPHADK